jgi:hypothetical protein
VGPSSSTTSTSAVGISREDPITYEELSAEHKQKFDEIKALFKADLISSFGRTCHHSVRSKGFSPDGALNDVELSTPSKDRTRALRQEVNYMVAHLLHRHSESLVNALELHRDLHWGVIKENCCSRPNHHCPIYSRLQNRKVHRHTSNPVDHQFFSEPPKEILYGYMCAYIPDSNNPVYSAQRVVGGMSKIDADKQAWLAKYATGPSHDSMHSALGVQTVDQISTILRDQFGILPKR